MFPLSPTPSPPRLLTRTPTATTIEYTVTTAPLPPASLAIRCLLFLVHLLARFVGFGVWVWVGAVKWRGGEEWREVMRVVGGWYGGKGSAAAMDVPWWVIVVCGVLTVGWVGRRGYTEDTILTLRNLGIQTRTIPPSTFSLLPSSWTWFLPSSSSSPTTTSPTTISTILLRLLHALTGSARGTTRFIPTSQIQDVWIHEGFVGFEVRFYLGVVVKGGEELVVVFERTRPRRWVLERVWRGVRGCLWGGREGGVEVETVKGGEERGGMGEKP